MKTLPLIRAVDDVLQQGLLLLDTVAPEEYGQVLPNPYAASVGQHYRHVLEHFACLSGGIDSFEVDYDSRERDVHIETEADFAREMTSTLLRTFQLLTADDLLNPCSVGYSVGYTDHTPEFFASSLEREIAFCVGHAIHHYAIIRIICAQLGVELPEDFGVAPSTIKHRATLRYA